jgi:hypothetical protein
MDLSIVVFRRLCQRIDRESLYTPARHRDMQQVDSVERRRQSQLRQTPFLCIDDVTD